MELRDTELDVLKRIIDDLDDSSFYATRFTLEEVYQILGEVLDPTVTVCYPRFSEGLRAAFLLLQRLILFRNKIDGGVRKISLFPRGSEECGERDVSSKEYIISWDCFSCPFFILINHERYCKLSGRKIADGLGDDRRDDSINSLQDAVVNVSDSEGRPIKEVLLPPDWCGLPVFVRFLYK